MKRPGLIASFGFLTMAVVGWPATQARAQAAPPDALRIVTGSLIPVPPLHSAPLNPTVWTPTEPLVSTPPIQTTPLNLTPWAETAGPLPTAQRWTATLNILPSTPPATLTPKPRIQTGILFPIPRIQTAALIPTARIQTAGLTFSMPLPDGIAGPVNTAMGIDELSDLRGGFVIANGVTLDFGAVVRTYVSGQLALESRLQWTDRGPVTSQTGSLPGALDLTDAMDDALALGLNLEGLRGGQGVLLSGSGGATALVHNLQNGGIQNLIVNNASNLDLRQELEINLTLPDLGTMQAGYSMGRFGSQIGQDLNSALLNARR